MLAATYRAADSSALMGVKPGANRLIRVKEARGPLR